MKEIKFRAVWKDTKKVEQFNNLYELAEFLHEYKKEVREDLDWYQFTGLLDKTGKEIYEDDIFIFRGEKKLYNMLPFEGGMTWAVCSGYNADGSDLKISPSVLQDIAGQFCKDVELVGNE